MSNILKIRRSVLLAILLVVGGMMLNSFLSGLKKAPKVKEQIEVFPLVNTVKVEEGDFVAELVYTGRLIATNKIDVFTEVTGILNPNPKSFKDGVFFSKGEVLVDVNNQDTKMNLVATRANFHSVLAKLQADLSTDYPDNFINWKKYISSYNPEKRLDSLPEVLNDQERNFLISRNVYNLYYSLKSQELKLDKFTIYAPFDGVIHNANLSPQSLVRAGQSIGQFIGIGEFELEIGVPLEDISKVSLNDTVILTADNLDFDLRGNVNRIGKSVNQNTQTYNVYIGVNDKRLSEGLYMTSNIKGKKQSNTSKVSPNLIIDGQYVYVLDQEEKLRKAKIKIVHESVNTVLVEGLKQGDILLNQTITEAKDGLQVKIAK